VATDRPAWRPSSVASFPATRPSSHPDKGETALPD